MLRFLDHLEEWLIGALMAAATLLIFVAVIHRYGMGIEALQPYLQHIHLSWAQELCIFMFVWMAKFGAAYGVRTGIHVGVDVLINRLSVAAARQVHRVGAVRRGSVHRHRGHHGRHVCLGKRCALRRLQVSGHERGRPH